MNQLFNFFFEQYVAYETIDIVLEIIAVVFGFLSVWFSKLNKIWVFPTGMISTSIFVYLLLFTIKCIFMFIKINFKILSSVLFLYLNSDFQL